MGNDELKLLAGNDPGQVGDPVIGLGMSERGARLPILVVERLHQERQHGGIPHFSQGPSRGAANPGTGVFESQA